MECEEREHHDIENRRRAQYEAEHGHPEGPVCNPDRQPRSQVVATARVTMRLWSATAATTWRSPPSPRWCHVSGRSPTPTTSSRTSRSKTAAPTPTFGCRPTTSPSRRPAAASTTWRPTSRW
jgi:hypothetical protein